MCFNSIIRLFSLVIDVINTASELLDGTRNNAGEMVALRCLEGLFGPLDDIGENGRPAQESKVMFDSSESCLDVVKRIYNEVIVFQKLCIRFLNFQALWYFLIR